MPQHETRPVRLNDKGQCPECLIKPLVYKRDRGANYPRGKFCHRCCRSFNIETGEQQTNWAWKIESRRVVQGPLTFETETEIEAMVKVIGDKAVELARGKWEIEWPWLRDADSNAAVDLREIARAALTAAAQVRREQEVSPVQVNTGSEETSRDHPDTEDELEELKQRARMIRSCLPKGNSISPMEVTAECIEWAVQEIERLRAQVRERADNGESRGLDVKCKCGWAGKQADLIWAKAINTTYHCPRCSDKFLAWPSTEPDSGPSVLGNEE